MGLFKIIEEAQCILIANGVYKQVPLYERNGQTYAKDGAGYIRLLGDNGTTKPKTRWEDIDVPARHKLVTGRFGAPEIKAGN